MRPVLNSVSGSQAAKPTSTGHMRSGHPTLPPLVDHSRWPSRTAHCVRLATPTSAPGHRDQDPDTLSDHSQRVRRQQRSRRCPRAGNDAVLASCPCQPPTPPGPPSTKRPHAVARRGWRDGALVRAGCTGVGCGGGTGNRWTPNSRRRRVTRQAGTPKRSIRPLPPPVSVSAMHRCTSPNRRAPDRRYVSGRGCVSAPG